MIKIKINDVRLFFSVMSLVVFSLSGCAPGTMKMEKNEATIATEDGVGKNVAIVPITIDLLSDLKQKEKNKNFDFLKSLFSEIKPYKIGAADILQIIIWDHPEIIPPVQPINNINNQTDPMIGFTVSPEGEIQFPYAGTVKVSGLTEDEAKQTLIKKISKYLKDPQITVRLASYRSKRVFVDGEVRTPGILPLNDIPMTLYEAINRAGGFLPTANQSDVLLIRKGKEFPIDFTELLRKGLDPAKIILQDGDALRAENREVNKVYLLGEVGKPAPVPMRKDGRLTLTEALGESSGLNPLTADAGHVYVLRNSENGDPEIFHLNAKSPSSLLLADQFELKPKDVIYVDASGLARFNRVLALLLPAGAIANNATNVAK